LQSLAVTLERRKSERGHKPLFEHRTAHDVENLMVGSTPKNCLSGSSSISIRPRSL
jgi:hypothetical protein